MGSADRYIYKALCTYSGTVTSRFFLWNFIKNRRQLQVTMRKSGRILILSADLRYPGLFYLL